MQPLGKYSNEYLIELQKRALKSKAFRSYQLTGLEVAAMLGDFKNKSLYIKLAKQHGDEKILRLAKTVIENKNVKNPAAYFMKILHGDSYHRQ